jgi:hypothetical protein
MLISADRVAFAGWEYEYQREGGEFGVRKCGSAKASVKEAVLPYTGCATCTDNLGDKGIQ